MTSPTRLFVTMSGAALFSLIVSPFLGLIIQKRSVPELKREDPNQVYPNQLESLPNEIIRYDPVPFPESRGTMESEAASNEIYWDLSCPWEMSHQSIAYKKGYFFDDPEYLSRPRHQTREEFEFSALRAKEFSLAHHTNEQFLKNAPELLERRTVIIGDSTVRQLFISIACLMPANYAKAHRTAWMLDMEQEMEFYDSRIRLQPSGELFYSPRAGGVNQYDWNQEWKPMDPEPHDWLKSCRERQPFQFNANYIPEHSEFKVEYGEGDPKIETVTLGKNDVVVINSGIHTTRPENMKRIIELFDCIQQAHDEGFQSDWPHFAYLKTSMKHFEQVDGYNTCCDTNFHTEDEDEDVSTFADRVPMVGKLIDYRELGFLHVNAFVPDCVHWLQPGLPDLQAVDVADYLGRIGGTSTS